MSVARVTVGSSQARSIRRSRWGTKVLGLESSSAADDLAPVTSQ